MHGLSREIPEQSDKFQSWSTEKSNLTQVSAPGEAQCRRLEMQRPKRWCHPAQDNRHQFRVPWVGGGSKGLGQDFSPMKEASQRSWMY